MSASFFAFPPPPFFLSMRFSENEAGRAGEGGEEKDECKRDDGRRHACTAASMGGKSSRENCIQG